MQNIGAQQHCSTRLRVRRPDGDVKECSAVAAGRAIRRIISVTIRTVSLAQRGQESPVQWGDATCWLLLFWRRRCHRSCVSVRRPSLPTRSDRSGSGSPCCRSSRRLDAEPDRRLAAGRPRIMSLEMRGTAPLLQRYKAMLPWRRKTWISRRARYSGYWACRCRSFC
jgi:hypothetical protein